VTSVRVNQKERVTWSKRAWGQKVLIGGAGVLDDARKKTKKSEAKDSAENNLRKVKNGIMRRGHLFGWGIERREQNPPSLGRREADCKSTTPGNSRRNSATGERTGHQGPKARQAALQFNTQYNSSYINTNIWKNQPLGGTVETASVASQPQRMVFKGKETKRGTRRAASRKSECGVKNW